MAINWSDIHSRKVRNAFRDALIDKQLTHDEVVDILHTLLKDGELAESMAPLSILRSREGEFDAKFVASIVAER